MGFDVRDLPRHAAEVLPDRLRVAGLNVEVAPHPRSPAVVITKVRCRRGADVQVIGWGPAPEKPDECRVYIGNARGWRGSVRHRRYQLQMEITAIIEQEGGYWPYPE